MPIVSIPPFVTLPHSVTHTTVAAGRGDFAVLRADPIRSHREAPSAEWARLLLVPGFTGSKEDFIAVLPLLQDAGIAAATYDQLGQFETLGPDDAGAYSQRLLASDVVALSWALWPDGPRPHLLGHSLGGLVARAAVLRDPTAFASLIMMCSGPAAVPEGKQQELRALTNALHVVDLETIWRVRQEADRAAGVPAPPSVVQGFLHHRWLRNNPHALRAKAEILLTEPDRSDELAAAGLPLAVVTGSADDVWLPSTQADMARRIGALDVGIADAGHSPAADQPSATGAALVGLLRILTERTPEHGAGTATAHSWTPERLGTSRAGYDGGMSVTSALPQDSGAAREARKLVESQLSAWGVEFVRDDLQLIASELVTNALTHTDGPVTISLIAAPDHVRIEVADAGSATPTVRSPSDDDDHGRGMAIVEMLSRAWGTIATETGKTVWAEVPLSEATD